VKRKAPSSTTKRAAKPRATALTVLNVERAPPGTKHVIARGRGAEDKSMTPCAHCPARCCQFLVAVSLPEALRLALTLSLPLSAVVYPGTWKDPVSVLRFSTPIVLDEGPRVLFLRQENGWCGQLVRAGHDDARCGIYELRPIVCRMFPFEVEVAGKSHSFGSAFIEMCEVGWLYDDATEKRLGADFARWRADMVDDRKLAALWNDAVVEDRSFRAFVRFAHERLAPRLGLDPRAAFRFPEKKKFDFLKPRTVEKI
jgi:Fe-S-cluster containining protein